MKKITFTFSLCVMLFASTPKWGNAQVEVSPFLTQVITPTTAYPHISKNISTPQAMTFAQAVSSCRNLKWNGDSTWYLPTAEELLLFSKAASDGSNRLVACVTQTQQYTDAGFYGSTPRGDTASGDDMCWAYKGTTASLTRTPASPTNTYARLPYYKSVVQVSRRTNEFTDADYNFIPSNPNTKAGNGLLRSVGHISYSPTWPFKFSVQFSPLDSLYYGLSDNFNSVPDFNASFYTVMPLDYIMRVKGNPTSANFDISQFWGTHFNVMTVSPGTFYQSNRSLMSPFPTLLPGKDLGGELVNDYTISISGGLFSSSDNNYAGDPLHTGKAVQSPYMGIINCFSCGFAIPSGFSATSMVYYGFGTGNSTRNDRTPTSNNPAEALGLYAAYYARSIVHTIAVGTAFDMYKNPPQEILWNLGALTNFILHQPAQNQRNGVHCVR